MVKTDHSKIYDDENDMIEESSAHGKTDESGSDEHHHSEYENSRSCELETD